MNLDGLNAEGEAALSFAWLVVNEPRWTSIDPHRLSFTQPGWDPLSQLDFTLPEGLTHLRIWPGNPAALGFAARTNPDGTVNVQDARRKRNQWVIFLNGANPARRAIQADPQPNFAAATRPAPIRCTR